MSHVLVDAHLRPARVKAKVLLIRARPADRNLVALALRPHEYEVQFADDEGTGVCVGASGRFDVIVLDTSLEAATCIRICRHLRRAGVEAGILVLCSGVRVADRVTALNTGADVCLTEPFDAWELRARMEALVRRMGKKPLSTVKRFRIGDIDIDFEAGKAHRDASEILLTRTELHLLRCLVENRNVILSRKDLLRQVWGADIPVGPKTVDVHIAFLRRKLERQPRYPRHLLTVRGVGYRFVP